MGEAIYKPDTQAFLTQTLSQVDSGVDNRVGCCGKGGKRIREKGGLPGNTLLELVVAHERRLAGGVMT